MNFCHISPTKHLNDLVNGRKFHLTLAHLVESDQSYVDFYVKEKINNKCTIIMDNSAFEMFKRGHPMYPADKLVEMGKRIGADYIVMSDYPGEDSLFTIEAAQRCSVELKKNGFGTFFVPQGKTGSVDDLIRCYQWAADNPQIVDYIGVSILAAPLAYGVEKGNKLQRFLSRLKLMYSLKELGILDKFRFNEQKIHLLGMVDGPNEVMFMSPFKDYIDTWDSSAASWLGLNGQTFDNSPSGRLDGKFELEVDFDFYTDDFNKINFAKINMTYIDNLCEQFLR